MIHPRDADLLLGLQKAGVRFVAADMPETNEMVVGIMAVIPKGERKMIPRRTKEVLIHCDQIPQGPSRQ